MASSAVASIVAWRSSRAGVATGSPLADQRDRRGPVQGLAATARSGPRYNAASIRRLRPCAARPPSSSGWSSSPCWRRWRMSAHADACAGRAGHRSRARDRRRLARDRRRAHPPVRHRRAGARPDLPRRRRPHLCLRARSGAGACRVIGGRSVTCTPVEVDRYNRDIAICMADGIDLGEAMVRAGHALDYARHSRGRYAAASAKRARRGAGCGPANSSARRPGGSRTRRDRAMAAAARPAGTGR